MIDKADLKKRLYQDGADLPDTPIQQEAERAFREAFLQAAKEAGQWQEPDAKALKRAWDERRHPCPTGNSRAIGGSVWSR